MIKDIGNIQNATGRVESLEEIFIKSFAGADTEALEYYT